MGLIFESIITDILSIQIAFLCVLIAYFKYSYTYWSRKGVISLPAQFPYGNTKDLVLQKENFGQAVTHLYKEFKARGAHYAGFYVFWSPQLLIIEPELIKTILTKDFAYFADRGLKIDCEKEPIQGHLFGLRGQKWKAMRHKLTPTFTSGKMKTMFQTISACAGALEEVFEEYAKTKEEIDVKEVFSRFTTDVIGSCAFGLDCNSMNNSESEFRHYGKKCFEKSAKRAFLRNFARFLPDLFNFLNLKLLDEDITDFFTKAVAATIDYRRNNNIKRNDFLQLLINIQNTGDVDEDTKSQQENKQNEELTLGEITAQCLSFFLAGFETSSTAMSFFLFDMCLNQEIQDKVRNEILAMLEKYDGNITYEGVLELQYMDMAMDESMRLHSNIPVIDRMCTTDYRIPDTDVIIEKGTAIAIPLYGLHSDPEFFPEPEKFDPERFSREETTKRHPFTFIPFGEGPRACIGLRFGVLQTKVGLVKIMKNYRFTISEKTNIPLKMDPTNFIFQVLGGVWMHVERI